MTQDKFITFSLYALIIIISAIVFLIGLIVILRLYKTHKNQKKIKQIDAIGELVNNYLFNEELEKDALIKEFRSNNLKTKFEKKITIKELLGYYENFKGESLSQLSHLFRNLELDTYIQSLTESKKWHLQARALYVAGVVKLKAKEEIIENCLNHKRPEVQEQSLLYCLKTAENDPVSFLAKMNQPLTLWQQAYIENGLKLWYSGPTPDFSINLTHNEPSIVSFSIHLIAMYNQFEHIKQLLPFLKNQNEKIRSTTIAAFAKLQYKNILPELIRAFKNETPAVKKEILIFVQKFGDSTSLNSLKPFLNEDLRLKLLFANSYQLLNPTSYSGPHSTYSLNTPNQL
ncbi:hypothetical protein SAMN04487906_2926 [Zhouia amylolytica]|uniref:HEAT repeat-containing protein n=1 Tax=Zhouia amylolytica TaxID=376730 RepID=A0A1I6V7R6_9FLAO|nr:HEAT repeat domain-containing protein [Zhouia amylolytica]SFT09680.1 hypothetical protein SAMN04487906_2926 [Zhouia amylolytica]